MNPEHEGTPTKDKAHEPIQVADHELLRVIGRGSYGEVWEARNIMGTPRAVKVVHRHDFDYARPFEREFEGIQRYEPVSRTHSGLVQVLHIGMARDRGHFYYVMELADAATMDAGESAHPLDYKPKTLRGEIQRRGRLPVEECIAIGATLASALGHLHRHGLVHRDVKPSNIIFVSGAPKLVDVGLVAKMGDTRSMVGTEGYFAPEGTGQPRSDVYSLGKVLYECVTGKDRADFPDVPVEWNDGTSSRGAFEFMEIVLRAAETNPERRYSNMEEMLADLALLQAGKSVRHLRQMERALKRTAQILAAAALTLGLAGTAWYYEKHRADEISEARQQTRKLLGDSLIAEARAVRLSRQAGARSKALDAVRRGLEAGASLRDLRTQAASALALTDAGEVTREGHLKGNDCRVVWSPDGAFSVATARDSGETWIRERASGRETCTFTAKPDVLEISVNPGATRVAMLHGDNRITLWNTSERCLVWESHAVGTGCRPWFSSDGTWLIYSTAPGIVARSSEGGEPVPIIPSAPTMRGIYIAPNGQWIAALALPSGPEGGRPTKDLGIRIYTGLPGGMPKLEDAANVVEKEISSDILLDGVSISGDSRYIAAAVSEDRLRVWEVPSLSQIVWLRGHQRSVRGTAFHPYDNNVVASTSWDGTTRLWDISTRQETMLIPAGGEQILINPGRGEILLRHWDGDGILSAKFSQRSALRVFNIPPVTPLGLFASVAWNAEGSLFASAGDAGVVVWDFATGQPFAAQAPDGPQQWRYCTFHPKDGSLYYSGVRGLFRRQITRGTEGRVTFGPKETLLEGFASYTQWRGDSLVISGRFDAKNRCGIALLTPNGTQQHLIPSQLPDQIGVSLDGRWLIVARYPGGGGTFWDMSSDPPTARDLETKTRANFNYSADSRVLITGMEKEITFTNPAHPEQVIASPVPRKNIQQIPSHSAISAKAGLVAVSTGPTEVTLLDGRSFEPLLTLDSALTPFDCSMCFSPDGTKLALAGGTSRVMVWDIAWIKEELTKLGLGW